MIISNTQEIPGKTIVEFFGVVSGSTVRAKHIGRDIMAGLKNMVGGELTGYTELLSEARGEAIRRMSLAITPTLLLGAWITGTILERRHLKSLLLLESGSRDVLAVTIEDLPPDWHVQSCELVMGNVVISQDYFKRFAATIKGIFGGNIRVFEPLLERARREALIRMKGVAHARGYDTIINVRLETATLASARPDGKGTAGVEILAYGTAISLIGPHTGG